MAKITFEAGDIISWQSEPSNEILNLEQEYLAVCLSENKCITFAYRDETDKNHDVESTVGSIEEIPKHALPVTFHGGVPSCWHQMFKALIEVSRFKEASTED